MPFFLQHEGSHWVIFDCKIEDASFRASIVLYLDERVIHASSSAFRVVVASSVTAGAAGFGPCVNSLFHLWNIKA